MHFSGYAPISGGGRERKNILENVYLHLKFQLYKVKVVSKREGWYYKSKINNPVLSTYAFSRYAFAKTTKSM